MEKLHQCFEAEFPDHVEQQSWYGRNLVEYCSYKTLNVMSKQLDYLAVKEFRHLTYDMMLAWETADAKSESLLKAAVCNYLEVEDDDGGSLFYASPTSMAIQVDTKKTVGLDAFSRIAPACPAVANPITVDNLFDVLTCASVVNLFWNTVHDVNVDLTWKSPSYPSGPSPQIACHYQDGKGNLAALIQAASVLKGKLNVVFIGRKPAPNYSNLGRLTLTNHAFYFEALGFGSYDGAVRYDLMTDLKQVIKRGLTGPWGARLFDTAVMYKSNSLAEPIFLEFPQFKSNSRRDYWFAIIQEVLHVHRFIRKYNLGHMQRVEALSKATIGIFQYRAVKEAFHIIPRHLKTTLAFSLAEKLPKGDKILEALYNQLKFLRTRSQIHVKTLSDENHHAFSFPVSLLTLIKMGFISLKEEDRPEEIELVADLRVGETSPLQMAVKQSINYSGIVEAARATLDQVKVEGIDTKLAVMKELLTPLVDLSNRLLVLAEWEDPFESSLFLFFTFYVVYRGWISYIFPGIFLSLAVLMLCNKYVSKGKQTEAFQITPPPTKNAVEQLLILQEVIAQLETYIQIGNIALLKLRAILFAAFPQATNKVAVVLIGTAAVFAIVPFKHLIVFILLEAYTRQMPLRKQSSEKLIRRIKEWWVCIPAAPVQLVRSPYYKKSN